MDVFDIDNVTRDNIFRFSLKSRKSIIHLIRRSLGFRHKGSATAKLPSFFSKDVEKLHKEIAELAKEHLPVESLKDLYDAWKEGVLLKDELCQLMYSYGKRIWGQPMDRRDIQRNPNSPLVVTTGPQDDEYYPVNLFFELESHRNL
jgi:hypothetical protein